ncbi:MAG TPA: ABC transporter permease [Saprospiraceae bacterium]|nr:ABC transporter permease [Saprospiraceae bacterium]HND86745.1 ABC transporter permease [Saprospiraceae bacterium]
MKNLARYTLLLLLALALGRDFVANERPLWCSVQGRSFFPALRDAWPGSGARQYAGTALAETEEKKNWAALPPGAAIFPPIPFQPARSLGAERGLPPGTPSALYGGRFRHWLGTDGEGRDVAACLVSGARVAVLSGLVAMGIALSIGLLLGLVAGYFGDYGLRVARVQAVLGVLSLPVAWYCAFPARTAALSDPGQPNALIMSLLMGAGVVAAFALAGRWLSRWGIFSKKMVLPADLLVMRLAELFSATPRLLVIVAVSAMADRKNQSTWLMMALIGAMSWPGVARLVRAELLKLREMDFMVAARGLGYSDWRIMLRHALPNALRAVLVAFALGVSSAILLEASLSILGYGLKTDRSPSWGMLLQGARDNPAHWWLVLFPSLAIASVVLALHSLVDERQGRQV